MSLSITRRRPGLRNAVVLASFVATLTLPFGAQAEETVETRVVSYADLDLSTEAGVDTMYRRLETAAQAVCGRRPELIELKRRALFEQCVDVTFAAALSGVRSAALAALLAEKRAASAG